MKQKPQEVELDYTIKKSRIDGQGTRNIDDAELYAVSMISSEQALPGSRLLTRPLRGQKVKRWLKQA